METRYSLKLMNEELDFPEAIGDPQRICDHCGKLDSVAFCIDDSIGAGQGEHLCFDCAGADGFCFGCGNLCAGMESFDFSPIPGYCSNCVDQIKSTVVEDDDDDCYDDYHFDQWQRMQ